MKYKYTVYLPKEPRYTNAVLISNNEILMEWSIDFNDPNNDAHYRSYIRLNTPLRISRRLSDEQIEKHFTEHKLFRTKQEFKRWHLREYFIHLI